MSGGAGDAANQAREQLVDGHGRDIGDVRVSVTDRCSFRCTYCMPLTGVTFVDRSELLSFDEIERLVRMLASMGVSSVRLTGGEPLIRRDLPALVGRLANVPGVDDLSLTTNGLLLAEQATALAAAGLRRVNVSLDALDHERFKRITHRDALDRVLAGLHHAASIPELSPVKVNVVALRDFTEHDAVAFAHFARDHGYRVRFIEFMPLDGKREWEPGSVLTGDEIRAIIEREVPLEPIEREAHATAQRYRIVGSDGGEVGFINPVSQPFCGDCNRIRITPEGTLRTCLFSLHETDLRGPMRAGASDSELEQIIRDAVWRKELKHRIGDPGFRQPDRTMSRIGG